MVTTAYGDQPYPKLLMCYLALYSKGVRSGLRKKKAKEKELTFDFLAWARKVNSYIIPSYGK